MYFGNGSQNDDFILHGVNLTNSCQERVFDVISDKELKFHSHDRVAKADIVFLRPWKEKKKP